MAMVERPMGSGPVGSKWWTYVLRGVVAILFGIVCFARPGMSLVLLVALFGAYALVDGIFALVGTERAARAGLPWGWLTFRGLTGIAAGVIAWFYPGLTALALLFLIAAWAIVAGISELVFAIRMRAVVQHNWLLALGGALSIAFGVIVALRPGAGALAVLWLIGTFAIILGVLQVSFGIRLREVRNELRPGAGPRAPIDVDRTIPV